MTASLAGPARAALLLALVASPSLAAQQDLDQLVADLGAEQPRTRQVAFNKLRGSRTPEALAALARSVQDLGLDGQILAARLLRQYPADDRLPVAKLLVSADRVFLRAIAAFWMVGVDGERAHLRCAAAVAATPPAERFAVLEHVTQIQHQAVWDAYLGWLQPGVEANVARQVLDRLARWPRQSPERLAEAGRLLMAQDDGDLRAVGAAWLIGSDPAAGVALAELLREQPGRYWQLHDLLQRASALPRPVLAAMGELLLEVTNDNQLRRISQLLIKHARPEAVTALREVASSDNQKLRSAAVKLLAGVPGGLDHVALTRLLRTGEVEERIVAVDTLRRRDDASGLPVLLELLPAVGQHRVAAVQALGKFRDRQVVPPLLDLLDDSALGVRRQAWTGLQKVLRGLFPFRRFDFGSAGYVPEAANRAAGIATLRAWWAAVE